jgi:hypothetical protein
MDGLSGAASVIAVIDISAKIGSLCSQYSMAVKDAKNDIDRVQRKVGDITHILETIKQLLNKESELKILTALARKEVFNPRYHMNVKFVIVHGRKPVGSAAS